MLFDLSFWVSRNDLRKKRGNRSNKNGANENNKRLDYTYKVGDMILFNRNLLQPKCSPPRDGPFEVTTLYHNGTLKIKREYLVKIFLSDVFTLIFHNVGMQVQYGYIIHT